MQMQGKRAWLALYTIIPLAIGLVVFDVRAHLSPGEHMIVLAVIVIISSGLALLWAETHGDVIEQGGVDALVDPNLARRARQRLIVDGGELSIAGQPALARQAPVDDAATA